jgi:hypothetical protein
MPIRISCPCGKSLNVRDDLAGKVVKCPGCGKPIRVKSVAGPAAKPAAPIAPAGSEAASERRRMYDLFDEEGFSTQVAAVCPACRAEMAAGAILCTKCGYNTQTGERLVSHKTAGVDIDHGTLALEKAKRDMAAADKMQSDLLNKAGMPWWALALILFMLGSGLTIAVLVVNASRRVDENFTLNPMALFLTLAGAGFYLVGVGASLMIIVHAFKQSTGRGLLCLFVPFYMLYHVITNWGETWKLFLVSVVMGGIGGGLFAAAAAQGGI